MKDVLEEIVAHKRLEVERFKQAVSPSTLYTAVDEMMTSPVTSMQYRLAIRRTELRLLVFLPMRSILEAMTISSGQPVRVGLRFLSYIRISSLMNISCFRHVFAVLRLCCSLLQTCVWMDAVL